MSKSANPTVVGAFVVGATVLAVGGVLAFGSGDFFKEEYRYVAFFDSSVAGLDVGAPVRFKGVQVGNVASISAMWTDAEDIHIPVEITLTEGTVQATDQQPDQLELDHSGFIEHLVVNRGLRAELAQDSFVTGKLFVALAFLPETPIRRLGGSELVEIPTTAGGLEKIRKTLEELPIEELVLQATDAIAAIQALVEKPEIDEILVGLDQLIANVDSEVEPLSRSAQDTLADLRQLLQDVDGQVDPVAGSFLAAVDDVRQFIQTADTELVAVTQELNKLLANVDQQVEPLSASAIAAMDEVQGAVAHIDDRIGKDYTILYRVAALLDEVASAAQSVRVLADYLERHPEALLSGKNQ